VRVILNLKDGTYKYPTNPTKRKMAGLITMLERENAIFEGKCTVEYTKEYKNEFEFNSKADLENKLWPCLEPNLVKEFTNVK